MCLCNDVQPGYRPRADARCLSVMALGEGGDYEGAATVGLSSDDDVSLAFNVSNAFFLKVMTPAEDAEGTASLEEVKRNGYDY